MISPPRHKRDWQVTRAHSSAEFSFVELSPKSRRTALSTETLTSTTHEMPLITGGLKAIVESKYNYVQQNLVGGVASLNIIYSTTNDIMYAIRVVNDVVWGDRTELVRSIFSNGNMHSLEYTVEKIISDACLQKCIVSFTRAITVTNFLPEWMEEYEKTKSETLKNIKHLDNIIDHASEFEQKVIKWKITKEKLLSSDFINDSENYFILIEQLGEQYTRNILGDKCEGVSEEMLEQHYLELFMESKICLQRMCHFSRQNDQAFNASIRNLCWLYLYDITENRRASLNHALMCCSYIIETQKNQDQVSNDFLMYIIAQLSLGEFEETYIIDASSLMYLFSNTENDYEGIDLFKLLMQTGNLWSRMPSLKADKHLHRSLLFFDTAEKAVMNNKCIPIEKYYKKLIECRMAQRSVLWKLAGSVNVGEKIFVGEKVGDLLYLRPFESSRRFFLKNEFDLSSPNVMPYDEEPITLTLEAALHKTLSYSFTTQRFAGPSEIWGMGDHTSVLSTDERSDPASYMSSNWKEYCKLMILTNDALLILVWPTDGTIWEIEYCLHEYPSKTILIMLPMSVVHNAEEKWNKSKDLLSTKYCSLPEYDPQGAFVFYNNNAKHIKNVEFKALWSDELILAILTHIGKPLPRYTAK